MERSRIEFEEHPTTLGEELACETGVREVSNQEAGITEARWNKLREGSKQQGRICGEPMSDKE